MLIFLPKEVYGLQKLQYERIDHDSLFAQMSSRTKIALSLPRFRIESTHQLVDPLKGMGLLSMFSEGAADFSGISEKEIGRAHV